jgi:hypothetical protein
MKILKCLLFCFFCFASHGVNAASYDYDEYMAKTKHNNGEYERSSQALLFKDRDFVSVCWNKLAPLSFELFYTININGKASNIVWFPAEIDASCLKDKLINTTFPKPDKVFYGWWLIWDGEGG